MLSTHTHTQNSSQVQDKDGNDIGISPIAGSLAVKQSALTRVALPMPILMFPPLFEKGMKAMGYWPKSPRMAALASLATVTSCLAGALPLSIGLFPQVCEVEATRLEPKFHHLQNEDQQKIEKLYFNRGL